MALNDAASGEKVEKVCNGKHDYEGPFWYRYGGFRITGRRTTDVFASLKGWIGLMEETPDGLL